MPIITPAEFRLRVELSKANERAALLDEQLRVLQAANEALYREAYDSTGGPGFDPDQPFGQPASTNFESAGDPR